MNPYPPGNCHIHPKGTFEDDFAFPKLGYVSSIGGTGPILHDVLSFLKGFPFAEGTFGSKISDEPFISNHLWLSTANIKKSPEPATF